MQLGIAIYLFFAVVFEAVRRYGLAFIAITVVLTLAGGAIAVLSGGVFAVAAKYTALGCLSLGGIGASLAAINAIVTGFR